jgi:hypothetical protein
MAGLKERALFVALASLVNLGKDCALGLNPAHVLPNVPLYVLQALPVISCLNSLVVGQRVKHNYEDLRWALHFAEDTQG